jgi:Predicted membrane protein (DUF2142)
MLARPISPLWVAIIAIVLAILGGGRAVVDVAKSRAARWSAVLLAACSAFALWWIVAEHALDLLPVGIPVGPGESGARLVRFVFGQTNAWLHEMVGVFGWLDTPSPLLTYVVWAVVSAALLALGLLAGWRAAAALLTTVVLVLAVPVAISVDQAHRLGIIWQGRYTLPLAVGLPLVAAASLRPLGGPTRWHPAVVAGAAVAASALALATMAAYLQALRRYAVGADGPVDFLHGRWHPPLGLTALALGGCVLIALLWAGVGAASWVRPLPVVAEEGPAADGATGAAPRRRGAHRRGRGAPAR